MVNRISIDTDALRISKPSYDVLTALDSQLLFNSNWRSLGMIVKGRVTTSNSVVTINYGKTFSSPPVIHLMYFASGAGLWYSFRVASTSFSSSNWQNSELAVNIQASYMQLYSYFSLTWAYVVMDMLQ